MQVLARRETAGRVADRRAWVLRSRAIATIAPAARDTTSAWSPSLAASGEFRDLGPVRRDRFHGSASAACADRQSQKTVRQHPSAQTGCRDNAMLPRSYPE